MPSLPAQSPPGSWISVPPLRIHLFCRSSPSGIIHHVAFSAPGFIFPRLIYVATCYQSFVLLHSDIMLTQTYRCNERSNHWDIQPIYKDPGSWETHNRMSAPSCQSFQRDCRISALFLESRTPSVSPWLSGLTCVQGLRRLSLKEWSRCLWFIPNLWENFLFIE